MNKDFSMIYEGLNPAQREAVEHIEGPSLIVAGAGSGKTRVLTCRIANILSRGHSASSVLALTFTNKASKEMKSRIAEIVGWESARYLWMGTFHSVFVRFLREYAELIGFPKSFTIYDTSDSKSAVRGCIKELQLDEKDYKPGEMLSKISNAKNNLITATAYSVNQSLLQIDQSSRKPRFCDIYKLYEKRCKQSGAMDFDDILLYTNILVRDNPQVLINLQNRFSFILVDEYQDTNYAQYLIVKKLAQPHGNICVVGDDSQSIYGFRGARIENILNFRKDYPKVREFRLEQNYRSTQTIVKAANSLIARNSVKLTKECFSCGQQGEKIDVISSYTDQEESFLMVSSILSRIYQDKASYGDFAVLYRTNAQSRAVEEALRKRSLPYKIFGGHSFYERAEVKDMLSYLRLLTNKKDDEAFKRVVNVPPRGIGDTTVGRLSAAANSEGVSLWEALLKGDLPAMGIKQASAAKLFTFATLIDGLSKDVSTLNAYDIAIKTLIGSGLMDHLKSDNSVEGRARLDNVEELLNSIKAFVEEKLQGSDTDSYTDSEADSYTDSDADSYTDSDADSYSESATVLGAKSATDLGADSANDSATVLGAKSATDLATDLAANSATDAHTNPYTTGPDFNSPSNSPSNSNSNSTSTSNSNGVNHLIMLPNYLENIALLSAQDENNSPEDSNKISLMTVHTAKGLEFPYVYIIGMEENLFPSGSMMGIPESEMEEERRLFYVGLTRAMNNVTLSYAQSRFRWGSHVNYPPSRFLKEIDPKFLNWSALESEGLGADRNWTRLQSSNSRNSYSRNSYSNNNQSFTGNNRPQQGQQFPGNNRSQNYQTSSGNNRTQQGQQFPDNNQSQNPRTPVGNIHSNRTVPAPKADFKADSISDLKEGQRVEHDRFGLGDVFLIEGEYPNSKATIQFDDWGKKVLLLKFAKLRIVD